MNNKKISFLLLPFMAAAIASGSVVGGTQTVYATEVTSAQTQNKSEVYLSDLTHEANSFSRYRGINKDTNPNKGTISLILNGSTVQFNKGIGAHAESQLIYDISAYSTVCKRLQAYMGIDASQGSRGDGAIITVSKSQDGQHWEEIKKTEVLKGNTNAVFLDVNVEGVKFIKFHAGQNANNGNDHVVYGDLKLVSDEYLNSVEKLPGIKTVAEYDEELRAAGNSASAVVQSKGHLIYQRELVDRVGYDLLSRTYRTEEDYREALTYLFTDEKALAYFIEAGVAGNGESYLEAVKNFGKIYNAHKAEITSDKDFLLKLAVSCSWSHSKLVTFWSGSALPQGHNPVTRYETYRDMVQDGTMDKGGDSNFFRSMPVGMMKFTTNARIHEDEIKWFADYAIKQKEAGRNYLDGYNYVEYKGGWNYNDPQYYTEENHAKWNEKYNIDAYFEYGLEGVHRNFIIFEEDGVCGSIAKTYTLAAEMFGRPAQVVHQPGHAAAIIYNYDSATGKGKWSLANDVFGWTKSRDEMGQMPLTWGMQPWNSNRSASYVLLAQDVLNDYQKYQTATKMNILAKAYVNDPVTNRNIYIEALKVQPNNLDSMYGLVQNYLTNDSYTSADCLELTRTIIANFKFYPLAMNDLSNLIQNKLNEGDRVVFDLLKKNALMEAQAATAENVYQPDICITMARGLLGTATVDLASFSFDGEQANQIVINEAYTNSEIRVRYSLDGGNSYQETNSHAIALSESEIAAINAENDILVGLVGVNDVFKIDIREGAQVDACVNDLENKFVGNIANLQYSLDGGQSWKDDASTAVFEGNVEVLVRNKAFGTTLMSASSSVSFQEDSSDLAKKYISIDNLTLIHFSSEQNSGSAGANMIDGNQRTQWHSRWNIIDQDKSYVVEFSEPKKLSSVGYVPSGVNGRIKNVDIYTSMDGTAWEKSASATDLANNTQTKYIDLQTPVNTKFVKIQPTYTYGNTQGEHNKYISGLEYLFFEDVSEESEEVETEVETSTEEEVVSTEEEVVSTEEEVVSTEEIVDPTDVPETQTNVITAPEATGTTSLVRFTTLEDNCVRVELTLPEHYSLLGGVSYKIFTENGTYTFKAQHKFNGATIQIPVKVTTIQ